MPRVYPAGHLIEEFTIKLPDGRNWFGFVYQTARTVGRRIRVVDKAADAELFDTGDCYDLGNATNRLDFFLAENAPCPEPMRKLFEGGYEPAAGVSLDRTMYDRWRREQANSPNTPQVCDVCKEVMDAEDQGQRTGDTVVCSPCIQKGGGVRLASPPQ